MAAARFTFGLTVLLAFFTLLQAPSILCLRLPGVAITFHRGNSQEYPGAIPELPRSEAQLSSGVASKGTITGKLRRVPSPALRGLNDSLAAFEYGLWSSVARVEGRYRDRRFIGLHAAGRVYPQQSDHAVEVQFGSPPQGTLLLIVDTGSSLTWTQCSTCKSCYSQPGPLFNPAASSSYFRLPCSDNVDNLCNYVQHQSPAMNGSCTVDNNCEYFISYGSGSVYTFGDLAQDTVTIGDGALPNGVIGCGYNNVGLEHFDGIVGLDASPLSFARQLGAFSFCFLPHTYDTSKSTPIVFGDPSFPVDLVEPGYSIIRYNTAWQTDYLYVTLEYISVNDKFIPNIPGGAFNIRADGSGGVIMDTGTMYSVLHDVVHDALVTQLRIAKPTNYMSGNIPCWPLEEGGIEKMDLPYIIFHMMTGDMFLDTPATYVATSDNFACLAIARATSTFMPMVIGNVQLVNQFVLVDVPNSKISFGLYDCSKLMS